MNNDGNHVDWTDGRRNYDFSNDSRCINSPNQNQLQRNPNNNINKSLSLGRRKQTNRNEIINNRNRVPAAQFRSRISQQPPNRTANAASKKPSTTSSTSNMNVTNRSVSKRPNSNKPSNNSRVLLPNPAAAARAIGKSKFRNEALGLQNTLTN